MFWWMCRKCNKILQKGFEIIKQDFLDGKLDFSKRILYTKRGLRKRLV